MKRIHFILIFLCPFLLFSQSKKGFKIPDSLKNKSTQYIYNAYHDAYQIDNEQAEFYANVILSKGKKDNNKDLLYDGYYKIARIKNLKGENGHPYADSLIALVKYKTYKKYPSNAYIIKGILYNNEGKYKDALDQYSIALKYSPKDDQEFFYRIKLLIGILKTATEEYKEALPLFKEYYDYQKAKIGTRNEDRGAYIGSIFSLANIYAKCELYEKSNELVALGIKECKKHKIYSQYNYLIMLKGINNYYLKNLPLSLRYLQSAERLLRKNKDYSNLSILYYFIGKVKHESHLEDEAIRYLIQSDSISYAIQDYSPVSRDGYEIIIDYYKKKGDIKN